MRVRIQGDESSRLAFTRGDESREWFDSRDPLQRSIRRDAVAILAARKPLPWLTLAATSGGQALQFFLQECGKGSTDDSVAAAHSAGLIAAG